MAKWYACAALGGALLMPVLAHAQSQPQTFGGFVGVILDLIQTLIAGIFGLTLLVLIWGIVQAWILHGGDSNKVADGRKIVTTGVIVLVIMSGIWGIVELLRAGLFGL